MENQFHRFFKNYKAKCNNLFHHANFNRIGFAFLGDGHT